MRGSFHGWGKTAVKAAILAAALAAFLVALPPPAKAAGQPVLLVYRLQSEQTSVTAILSALGCAVTAVSEVEYKTELLYQYSVLVTTIRKPYLDALELNIPVVCLGPETGPVSGVRTETAYGITGTIRVGGIEAPVSFDEKVHLIKAYEGAPVAEMAFPLRGSFPFGVIMNSVAYVPGFAAEGAQPLALGLLLRTFLGIDFPGRLFLWIDEVYPFSDLGMLCHMADSLQQEGYPFTVSAMPVYENLGYPAFLRYAQVLRYVQSRGGAVVLHEPVVRAEEGGHDSVEARLQTAREALSQQQVYLANGIVSPYPLPFDDFKNLAVTDPGTGSFPMDMAVMLPMAGTQEEFFRTLHILSDKWVEVTSLYGLVSREPYVYDEQPVDSAYAYREDIFASYGRFFSAGNQTLLTVVLTSLVVFIGLLILGYVLNRRKFFR